MNIAANVVKIVLLLTLSIPAAIIVLGGHHKIRFARGWAVSALALSIIVIHYIFIGKSKSPNNNEILLAGVAILNTSFWWGNCLRNPRTVKRFAGWLAVAAGAFVFWNLQPGNSLNSGNYIDGNYVGVTTNANILGGYLAVFCVPLLLQSALQSRLRYVALFNWGLVFSTWALIMLTRSRASLFALGVGVAFVILTERRVGRTVKLLLVGTIFAATAAMTVQASSKYLDIGFFGTRDVLIEQRVAAIKERPWFGWGFNIDVYAHYYQTNAFPSMEKGNTVLQAMEELGVPFGGVLMVGFFALAWYVAYNMRSRFGEIAFSGTIMASSAHLMLETWLFNFQSILSIYLWLILLVLGTMLEVGVGAQTRGVKILRRMGRPKYSNILP